MSDVPLLQLRDVCKTYARKSDLIARILQGAGLARSPTVVHALNGVDLDVHAGEIVGIVGESGCGKSTLGRLIVGLEAPDSGRIVFRNKPVHQAGRPTQLDLQMVFQDAAATLNPRLSVGQQLVEAPLAHNLISRHEASAFLSNLLVKVGLGPEIAHRYPHQFSGGQRQRLIIARSLAVSPKLLVCDESVASLDLSIQAQILNLLLELRAKEGVAIVIVSHDLAVVQRISDRVNVLYLGKVLESGTATQIFLGSKHPYTQALVSNRLSISGSLSTLTALRGEPPSPTAIPAGCPFHPRCPKAVESCRTTTPEMRLIAPDRQLVRCDQIAD